MLIFLFGNHWGSILAVLSQFNLALLGTILAGNGCFVDSEKSDIIQPNNRRGEMAELVEGARLEIE